MNAEQRRIWRILTGQQQRWQQELADYHSRNPPRQPRARWQQGLILAVPAMVLIGMIYLVL